MAKEDLIEMKGVVIKQLGGGCYQIECSEGEMKQEVVAKLSGKMAKSRIRVIAGDTVRVEVSPYDLTKGRIVYREK